MIASSSRPFNSLPEARFSGVGEFECNAGNVPSALWTRDPTADDWAALCAVPVILFNAWRQIRAPFAEILDTAPPPDIEAHVRQVAAQVPGIIGLEKCFVRKVGFRYYVDLHVVVDGDMSARSGHRIASGRGSGPRRG